MKWLYRILRLFKCPHYFVVHEEMKQNSSQGCIGKVYIRRCKRCGILTKTTVDIFD